MIDFEKPYHMLYYGVDTVVPKGFVESIVPYMSNGEQTLEDLISTSNAVAKETAQLGKSMVVRDDNTIIYPEGSRYKKVRKFRENFHPDILERRRFMMKKGALANEYRRGVEEGIYPNEEFPTMGHFFGKKMREAGFGNWYSNNTTNDDDEEILEPEEDENA